MHQKKMTSEALMMPQRQMAENDSRVRNRTKGHRSTVARTKRTRVRTAGSSPPEIAAPTVKDEATSTEQTTISR